MGDEADADWQAGLIEMGIDEAKPKITKLRVQAQHLQPGDIVDSGEVVKRVLTYAKDIPKGKCEVALENPNKTWIVKPKILPVRVSYWGKYTMINVERPTKTINEMELEEERKFKD